ncbi:Sec-independent protein translocase protein TatB [Thioflexithrix psekupsensis]|uniref:Sec-independent protein translocase protein TatB n=1 Tax=Thioflexithrix psekupsensis TaxID=1570016 RepID=A0A251XD63_9GAMM|nr:Sec-independent protein translocase protein TatB [Thioflexithrix psekupsensis]OUD16271.1 twin arginine-targeting protein translocase TatB [Thioflexithrix psekupsensis]
MFDIGFLELLVVGVVALLVFGPERLPGAARTAGLWFGRIKRFVTSIKNDIDKELRLQELQEQMRQTEVNQVYEFLNETKNTLNQSATAPEASAHTPLSPSAENSGAVRSWNPPVLESPEPAPAAPATVDVPVAGLDPKNKV